MTIRAYASGDLWNQVASTTAASTGKYTLAGLSAGSYVIQFDVDPGSGLLDEWYTDKSDRYSADRVELLPGANRTGVDVTLAKAASVSGVVTVPRGTPGGASSVFVAAYDATQNWLGSANVSEDGSYAVGSLPAGAVLLQFSGSSDSGLVAEWFDDEASFSSADAITLVAGEKRTGVNATLATGAVITGRVSVPNGTTIDDWTIRVSAYAEGQNWVRDAYVSRDGTYRLTGLRAGDYRLRFDADNASGLLDEWYDDAGSYTSAQPVTVATGATRSGIDATLARGASLSGRVTVPSGSSPSDVSIQVYDATQSTVAYANVAVNGTYSVGGLPSGSVRVYFSAMSPSSLQSEWWNDKPDFASATPVDLTPGQKRTGINATLTTGASIAGRVTAPAGSSLFGGSVLLYTSEYASFRSTPIASDGSYAVTGLPAGTYRVKFQPPWNSPLLPEWYDDAARYPDAVPITVTNGESLSDVNAALAVGGTITGKVTVPAGTPRSSNGVGIQVSAYLEGGGSSSWFSATVSADGTYALRGLPVGRYRVSFQAPDDWGLIDEYYDDVTTYSEATPVPVGTSQTVSGVDAALAAGGSVAGRVTLPAGMTVDSMEYRVTAYGPQMSYVASAGLKSDGTYVLRGLPAGNYRLQFSSPHNSGVLSEWYTDKAEYWSADSLTLTAGQGLTNVNAALDRAGAVIGSVRDAAGAGVAGARVTIYARSGTTWVWRTSVTTNSTGAYTFSDLSPATYTLQFEPPTGSPLLGEWWKDTPDRTTATGFTLAAGQVRTSLATTLTSGATVTGTVRSADGAPLAGAQVRVTNRAGADLGTADTNGAGVYVVRALPAGDVAAGVVGPSGLTYANGSEFPVAATFQTVSPGRSTTVDIRLAGRSISGFVTAADTGAAMSGGTVVLYSSTGAVGMPAPIGKTGAYVLRNIPRGTYTILVRPAGDTYAPTWADGAPSAAEADYFSVGTASVKRNLTVLRAGGITGTLAPTQQSGSLSLWRAAGGTWTWVASNWTSPGQSFAFPGLAPGVYAVLASSGSNEDPTAAPGITVGAGAHVDVGTVTDVPAGSGGLSGTVTGITSVTNVYVYAESTDGRSYSASVQRTMDKTYAYSFPALKSGSYTVRIVTPSAPVAWFGGTSATARKVVVASGGSAIANVAVAAGKGSLVGTVTGADGAGVPGASVSLVEKRADGGYVDSKNVTTGADGRYSFPSMLAPGRTYTVSASRTTGIVTATVVARSGSQTQDMAFEAPARVKGVVVDAKTGAPVAGTPVRIVRDGGSTGDFQTVTDSRGRYDLSDVPSGSYRVQAGASGSESVISDRTGSVFAPEWISDALTHGTATPLPVKAGSVVTAPTIRLSAGGVLTGRVKATLAGGETVWMTNVRVTVKTLGGSTVLTSALSSSGAPGAFSIVLPAGTYRVCASVPEWVPLHSRFDEACKSSTVTVTAGAVTSTANVALTERRD